MKLKSLFWSLLTVLAFSWAAVGCDDDDPAPTPGPGPDPDPDVKTPELVLTATEVEVTAEGGAQTLAFTIKNAVEGQQAEASCGAEWISDLKVEKENVAFTVAANDAELREAVVTLRYKGAKDAQFTVKQAAKGDEPTPPAGDGPKLELTANYDAAQKVLCADIACTTKNAEEASLTVVPSNLLDQEIQGGTTLEDFMESPDSFAQPFNAEMMAVLNGEGFKNEPIVAWEPDLDGMLVSVVVLAKNSAGKTAARSDAKLGGAPEPTPGDGPQVELTVRMEGTDVIFAAVSSTKNVASGELIINGKSDFDEFLATINNDMERMVNELAGMGQNLTPDWCKQINSDLGLELSLADAEPGVVYAGLMIVYDADNHRGYSYAYADKSIEPEPPVGGALEVDFTVDADSESFALNAVCTTKNAADAYVSWDAPEAVNKAIADGATLEQVMDSAKEQQKAQKFERAWIKEMNGAGISLTLNAKPNTSMAFILDVTNAEKRVVKRADATTTQGYTGPSYVQKITDAQFREKVWDYKANSQFTFKGNKPCVLDFGAPAWCGWCVKLEPVMNEASAEFKDKVDFYMLDTDYQKEAHAKMAALLNAGGGVPLLIIVDAQGNCKVIGGYIPMAQMRREINAVLGKTALPAVVKSFVLADNGNMEGLTITSKKYVSVSEINIARPTTLKNLFAR